jgi:hypothetical protein
MVNTGDSSLFQLIQKQFEKINWTMVAYIIFAIITTTMGVKTLMPMGTQRATIFGIGAVLIFIFYYYRWFPNGTKSVANWPPSINTCPDYLTFVGKLPGTQNSKGCVDLLGIASSSGGLQRIGTRELSSENTLSTNKYFNFTSTDVLNSSPQSVKVICQYCLDKGVTWEGVWDGDSCTGISTVQNLSNSSANCPK